MKKPINHSTQQVFLLAIDLQCNYHPNPNYIPSFSPTFDLKALFVIESFNLPHFSL